MPNGGVIGAGLKEHRSSFAKISNNLSLETDRDNRDAFWLRHLQNEYRIHSKEGLRATWSSLKDSGDKLPMQGSIANDIWHLFLHDETLHEELFQYAVEVKSRSGILFDRLYEFLMQRVLAMNRKDRQSHTQLIMKWHQRFLDHYFIRPGALNELVTWAKCSKSNLEIFQSIYRRGFCSPRQGVYDQIVPFLCKVKELKLALDWHFFLLARRDLPQNPGFLQSAFENHPTMEQTLLDFGNVDPTDVSALGSTAKVTSFISQKESQVFNPTSLSNIRDDEFTAAVEKMDDKPRHAPLSDEFCARLFATHGIPVPSVVRYLQMFGHGNLGPLAMREMLTRAKDMEQVHDFLDVLKDANIVIGIGLYLRVVQHFVCQGDFELLQNLVHSDLHPDVIQDLHTQETLLKHYVLTKQTVSARRTIEILRILKQSDPDRAYAQSPSGADNKSRLRSMIMHFEAYRRDGNLSLLQIMLDDQLSEGYSLTRQLSSQLTLMISTILPKENHESSPARNSKTFVGNTILRIRKAGRGVTDKLWIRCIAQHGMLLDLNTVFRLVSSFVREHYTKPILAETHNLFGLQAQRSTTALEGLLTNLPEHDSRNPSHQYRLHETLANIVFWGFKSALPRLTSTVQYHSNAAEVHLSGLRFLSELSLAGFSPDRATIASAVNRRLVILYGPVDPTRHINQTNRRRNDFTLEELLVAIEEIWVGPRLFPELYHDPGVPVDRNIRQKPRYFDATPEVAARRHSVRTNIVNGRMNRDIGLGAWKYHDFMSLSDRYGGSMLDGLLCVTTPSTSLPLSRAERIERRIHLRYFFLGADVSSLDNGKHATKAHRDRLIRQQAIQADDDLIRNGLCAP